jgi:DGQHR domain-containing protein
MSLTQNETQALTACYQRLKGHMPLTVIGLVGKEGNRLTYTAKLTFAQLAEQFNLVPTGVLPETVKLQRDLVSSRTNKIQSYLKNNDDFVFPAVIAVVEALNIETLALNSAVEIKLTPDSYRWLVDGQGRLASIKNILSEFPEYGDNTIDVKFILSLGVEKDAQLFTDINTTPTRPNKSQCIAMDSRSILNSFAKHLVQHSPVLANKICYSKSSVTRNATSDALWTLNQVTAFILIITGLSASQSEAEFSRAERRDYWFGFINAYLNQLCANPTFDDALHTVKPALEIRQNTIIGTSVFLKSMALLGKIMMLNFIESGEAKADWSCMQSLANIDLSYNNTEWLGRCLNFRGGYEDKSFNHKAMASYFCDVLAINKPQEIIEAEIQVSQSRSQLELEVA